MLFVSVCVRAVIFVGALISAQGKIEHSVLSDAQNKWQSWEAIRHLRLEGFRFVLIANNPESSFSPAEVEEVANDLTQLYDITNSWNDYDVITDRLMRSVPASSPESARTWQVYSFLQSGDSVRNAIHDEAGNMVDRVIHGGKEMAIDTHTMCAVLHAGRSAHQVDTIEQLVPIPRLGKLSISLESAMIGRTTVKGMSRALPNIVRRQLVIDDETGFLWSIAEYDATGRLQKELHQSNPILTPSGMPVAGVRVEANYHAPSTTNGLLAGHVLTVHIFTTCETLPAAAESDFEITMPPGSIVLNEDVSDDRGRPLQKQIAEPTALSSLRAPDVWQNPKRSGALPQQATQSRVMWYWGACALMIICSLGILRSRFIRRT